MSNLYDLIKNEVYLYHERLGNTRTLPQYSAVI